MNDQSVKQWKGKIQSDKAYVLFYAKDEVMGVSRLKESQSKSAQKLMAKSPVPSKQLLGDASPPALFISTQDAIKELPDDSSLPAVDCEAPQRSESEIVDNVESNPQQEQPLVNQQQKQQKQKQQQQKEKNKREDEDADAIAEKTILAELCVDAPTNEVIHTKNKNQFSMAKTEKILFRPLSFLEITRETGLTISNRPVSAH